MAHRSAVKHACHGAPAGRRRRLGNTLPSRLAAFAAAAVHTDHERAVAHGGRFALWHCHQLRGPDLLRAQFDPLHQRGIGNNLPDRQRRGRARPVYGLYYFKDASHSTNSAGWSLYYEGIGTRYLSYGAEGVYTFMGGSLP